MDPPSRRRDGHPALKPALAGDAKWPCCTLHAAPSLQPLAALAGLGCVQAAAAALREHGALEAPVAVAAPAPPTAEAARRSAHAGAGPGGVAPGEASTGAVAGGSGGGGARAEAAAAVATVARGAADLRRCLQDAGAAPLALLWLRPGGDPAAPRAALAQAAADCPGALLCAVADASASSANRLLCCALKADAAAGAGGGGGAPDAVVVQLFKGKALQRTLRGPLTEAVRQLREAVGAPPPPPPPSPVAAPTTPLAEATAAAAAAAAQPRQPSEWDPPVGKAAKAGARRAFPGQGEAVFWPRMPCLRCGSPWWLGEDWDARCARCGWDCEHTGYDDDSNPLPAYKAKFDAFRAAILAGHTPEWRRRGTGSGGRRSGGAGR